MYLESDRESTDAMCYNWYDSLESDSARSY